MTQAFYGGLTFYRGDGASPEVFIAVGEVMSVSGLGKTNNLIDATSFDSGSTKEYIAGMADGQEISLECNQLLDESPSIQAALISDVNNGTNRNVRLTQTKSTVSPNVTKTYDFTVTPISWAVNPSIDDKNTISFTLKISGDITVS